MTYTLGPWRAERNHSQTSGGRTFKFIMATGPVPVAGVTMGGDGFPADEGRANLALIEAAPDLLAALKAILPWHDSHPTEATDNRIINQCRAAIARAEGKDAS